MDLFINRFSLYLILTLRMLFSALFVDKVENAAADGLQIGI